MVSGFDDSYGKLKDALRGEEELSSKAIDHPETNAIVNLALKASIQASAPEDFEKLRLLAPRIQVFAQKQEDSKNQKITNSITEVFQSTFTNQSQGSSKDLMDLSFIWQAQSLIEKSNETDRSEIQKDLVDGNITKALEDVSNLVGESLDVGTISQLNKMIHLPSSLKGRLDIYHLLRQIPSVESRDKLVLYINSLSSPSLKNIVDILTGFINKTSMRGTAQKSFTETFSDTKLFAILFGDTFIKNTDFEGSTIETHINCLKDFCANRPEYKEMRVFLERFYLMPRDPIKLAELIQEVPVGKSLLLQGGWASSGTQPGHACLYELKKKEGGLYDIYIYNTGAGTERFHEKRIFIEDEMEKTLICPFVKYQNVPLAGLGISSEKIDDETKSLLGNLISLKDNSSVAVKDSAKQLYQQFKHLNQNPYRVTLELDPSVFMTPQRAGTCALKCCEAALRNQFPRLSDYKRFKLDLKMTAFIQFYEQHLRGDFVDPEQKKLFLEASKKILKTVGKLTEQELLSEEQSCKFTGEILLLQSQVALSPVQVADHSAVSAQVEVKAKENLCPLAISTPEVTFSSVADLDCPDIQSVKLDEFSKTLHSIVENSKKLQGNQRVKYIEGFVEEIPLLNSEEFLQKIPEEELRGTLSDLSTLFSIYQDHIQRLPVCLAQHQNTAWSLLALAHGAALRIDPLLAECRLPSDRLLQASYKTSCFTMKEVEKRKELIAYYTKAEDREKPILFEFKTEIVVNCKGDPHELVDIKTMLRIAKSSPVASKNLDNIIEGKKNFFSRKNLKLSKEVQEAGIILEEHNKVFTDENTSYIKDLHNMAYLVQTLSLKSEYEDFRFGYRSFWEVNNESISFKARHEKDEEKKIEFKLDENIPKDIKVVLDELSSRSRKLKDENDVLVKGGLEDKTCLSLDLCEPTLQCSKVLYDFQVKMLLFLGNETVQESFLALLFCPNPSNLLDPSPLIQTALKNPLFCKQMTEFIRDGLDFFQNRQPQGKPNQKGCLFFMQLIRRLEQAAPKDSSLDLKEFNTQKIINQLLSLKPLTEEIEISLHLHRINQYASKNLTSNNIEEMMVSWLFLSSQCDFDQLGRRDLSLFRQKEDCFRLIYSLIPHLRKWPGNSLDVILSSYFNEQVKCQWNNDKFPVYTGYEWRLPGPLDSGIARGKLRVAKTGEVKDIIITKTWQVNLLSGKVLCNGAVRLVGSVFPLSEKQIYREVFGLEAYPVTQVGGSFEFKTPDGLKFRFFETQKALGHLQLEVDGEWFEYQSINNSKVLYKEKIPQVLRAEHHLFYNGSKYCLFNKKTKEIAGLRQS